MDKYNYSIRWTDHIFNQMSLGSNHFQSNRTIWGKAACRSAFNFLQKMYNTWAFPQPEKWGCTEQQLGYQQNFNHQYQTNLQAFGHYLFPQPWLFNQQQEQQHNGMGTQHNMFSSLPFQRPNVESIIDPAIPNVFAAQPSYQLEQHNLPHDIMGTSKSFHILSELI